MSLIRRRMMLAITAFLAALAAVVAVNVFPRLWSPEHRLSDWMVTFLSPTEDIDPDIVLVTIRDDFRYRQNLDSLLPTDRFHLADLTTCLSNGGSAAIGFDMLFDWRDADGTQALENSMRAASKATPIVIGTSIDTNVNSTFEIDRDEISRFAKASNAKLAVIDLESAGESGPVRFALGDKWASTTPVFSSLVARLSGKEISNPIAFSSERFRIAWAHGKIVADKRSIRFTDFASLDIVELCKNDGAGALQPLIGGKIILVGSRAQRDAHKIPFSTFSEYSDGMTGLEIHATITAQILNGPNIVEPGKIWSFLIAFFAACLGMTIHLVPSLKVHKKFVLIGMAYVLTIVVWSSFALLNLLLPLSLVLIAKTNGAFAQQAGLGLLGLTNQALGLIRKMSGEENRRGD